MHPSEYLASDSATRMTRACTVWHRDETRLSPCCNAPLLVGVFGGEKVATACPDCPGYWLEKETKLIP